MNQTTIATMIRLLKEHQVEPDAKYVAAAGADWGYVAAWVLPKGDYILRYGDNGSTDYDMTDDVSDLACWLLPGGSDSCDGSEDAPIIVATVRGVDAVVAAVETDEGPFRVIVTRSYYGPTERSSWAQDDDGHDVEFNTYDEAEEWIDEQDSSTYCTSSNESGRPTYTIVS